MGPDAAPAPRQQSAVAVEQEEARPRAHSNSAAASREPSEIAENTVSADTPARTPPNTDQDASEPSQPTEEPAGAESESAAAESQAPAHQQAAQPESQSAPDPEQEAPRTDDEAREDGDSSTQTTYTWRDGEHSRTVTYQAELTVVTSREGESEIVQRQAASAQSDGPPVFRSDTGELMTLPGGVLLVLNPDSDSSRIDQFFAVNGISRGRVHDQTFTTNAFFIDTEPGLPSLNLAIQLAGQEGVVIASPNWEREATPQASGSLMPLLEPRSVEALADCAEIDRSAGIDDPYYGCQWHLKNTGQFRDSPTSMPDIRVEDVWDASDPETMGEGIRIAIVDTGMHSAHEDLSLNVDTSRNHNYRNGDSNISGSNAGHGTSVAGIIAARDNSVGVRGVAPRATIYGYNLIAGRAVPDANVADAMTRDLADTAVSNNSWGFGHTGAPVRAHATWEAAVVNGVENGFGGKGVVYVWSGGNSYRGGDHANLDGQANHYAVTTVCAVNYKDVRSYYSELGANLWVCGLSGNVASGRRHYLYNPDGHLQPITTTDNGNRYRETFSGTAAAAPIVSGVVALMRAANDQLTWRDVKVILANSARKNDPGNSGWLSGAAKYRSPMESYSYNLAYGFGVVDAKAAVDLAKTWTNLPPWRTTSDDSTDQAKVIPDAPSNSVPGSTIESTLTVDDYVRFVEFVEININMVHSQFKDLAIELVSPSGNVSTLTTARRKAGSAGINGSYRFGSARHLGESPAGTWKLRVTDRRAGNSGTLRSWNVTVYGHGGTPGQPTLGLPTPGDQSITAHWMALDDPGGSAVTSYDLRFIRSDASDKSDLRWTTRTDIATDTYEITGLDAGVYYDIQVRAHNDLGAGLWSMTVQGSTSPVAPETPAAPNITARARELQVSWTPPMAGQVGILRYDLRYILSSVTAEEKEDGDNWTEEVAWTTGSGELKHTIDNLTNDVGYDVQARAANSQGTSEWSSTSAGAPFLRNKEPAFPMSETGIRSVSENTPAGQNIGAAIRAIDPNGDNLTYESFSLDFKHFAIDESSGQIQTKKPLNHEHKSSYTFIVYVSDHKDVNAEADTTVDDTIMVTVTVEDVNEPPVVTGDMEHDITENSGRYVAGFNATDPENDVFEWRLSGPDAGHFEVSNSGALSFVADPDYDADADADGDNGYEVFVEAFDGSLAGRLQVTINILDVNEALVAEDDSVTVREDTPTSINVLANDRDPESADLTVTAPANTGNASLVVQPGGLIRYSPNPNFDKQDRFTYHISDGINRAAARVFVTIEPVNDAPDFPAGPIELEVAKDAQEGDKVGQPVTATDVEGDRLTYGLIGDFPFEIDTSSGQILVGSGASFDPTVQDTYTVAVRARDPGFATDDIVVSIKVVDQVTTTTTISTRGTGGGGGGGGGGPTPSEVEFEWTVDRDIEELDGANDRATGVWSDGTTLWVADNADGAGDAVYAYDRESGERLTGREFALHETNRAPRGFWSDGETVWVSDSGQERLFAYDLATGERLEEREFALAAGNSDARGIWSDEETMWVLDGVKDSLFAYGFESGELLAEYELDAANDDPRGIWSDGVTIWVSDHGGKRLFAYRLPALPDAETDSGDEDAGDDARELERVRDEEFSKLSRASNNSPRGIWSDGDVMYVADESDDRVYSYNMPDAIDARLASLTLSGVDVGEFDPGRTDYEGAVADGVTETTVEAAAMQRRTDVAIDPPDADGDDANGHQVALQDLGEITVTVTSQDGSRKKTYRVQFPETAWDPARDPWPHCLRGAISEGFSLVVYEGGSVEELIGCAESRGIVALYAPHEGVYVSHILGAPDFVNAGFLELFPDGLPPVTPLVAGSNGPPSPDPFGDLDDGGQPWPECLRGDIATGFSLVVSEGGSADELGACAQSRDVAALYALSDGVFVSYILGAPDLVNAGFLELFADGVPLITPLVARSEDPPGAR